jgi:diaminopimelate decarboxylase
MTKPIGPIPPGFSSDGDGMLLIGGRSAQELVQQAGGTPLFVYDLALIDAKIARFRAAVEGVDLHYAMKQTLTRTC